MAARQRAGKIEANIACARLGPFHLFRVANRPGRNQVSMKIGEPISPEDLAVLFNGPGIRIPDEIMASRELSPGAKMIYGILFDATSVVPVATIAAEIGVSVRQCKRYLAQLREQGWLR